METCHLGRGGRVCLCRSPAHSNTQKHTKKLQKGATIILFLYLHVLISANKLGCTVKLPYAFLVFVCLLANYAGLKLQQKSLNSKQTSTHFPPFGNYAPHDYTLEKKWPWPIMSVRPVTKWRSSYCRVFPYIKVSASRLKKAVGQLFILASRVFIPRLQLKFACQRPAHVQNHFCKDICRCGRTFFFLFSSRTSCTFTFHGGRNRSLWSFIIWHVCESECVFERIWNDFFFN